MKKIYNCRKNINGVYVVKERPYKLIYGILAISTFTIFRRIAKNRLK